jgi:hypothetical protein
LVDDPRVMVVAGRAYTEAAREIWPHAIAPLAGVGGLGRQLARLASITHAGQCEMSSADRPRGRTRGECSDLKAALPRPGLDYLAYAPGLVLSC